MPSSAWFAVRSHLAAQCPGLVDRSGPSPRPLSHQGPGLEACGGPEDRLALLGRPESHLSCPGQASSAKTVSTSSGALHHETYRLRELMLLVRVPNINRRDAQCEPLANPGGART